MSLKGYFIVSQVFAEPQCGWQCSGSDAVCKPGGDEWVDYGYGCPCHIWCEGNGCKTSDSAPCIGSRVCCSGQWNRRTEGCCNAPAPTPTRKPTPTPTPTPTLPTGGPTPTTTPTSPTPTISISPTPPPTTDSWFQTQEGDVHSNGLIAPDLPDGKDFSISEPDNSPGLVSYADDFDRGNPGSRASSKGWLLETDYQGQHYDYSYFTTNFEAKKTVNAGQLNGNQLGTEDLSQAAIWQVNNDLTVNSLADDLGVKVFFVAGKVIIKGDLDNTATFPVFISNGVIEIDPDVHQIRAILISDSRIKTGNITEDKILTIKGLAISWGDFRLERERDDNNEPAELFVFDPKALIKLKPILGKTNIARWQEVVP